MIRLKEFMSRIFNHNPDLILMREKYMKFTAIFEDAEEGGYTCWFEEMPEVISEGETIQEAKENLLDALNQVFEYKREKLEQSFQQYKNQTKEVIEFNPVNNLKAARC